MASSVASALCIVLCICSLQTAVLAKREKIELTVYVNEHRGGPNSTVLAAAGTGEGSLADSGWGSILVFENILREGVSAESKLLGRLTGSGLISTEGGLLTGGVQVSAKIWFSPESVYKGSSVTVVGTFSYPLAGPWELTVIAGTGQFRGYIGYAIANPEPSTTVPPLYVYQYKIYLFKQF